MIAGNEAIRENGPASTRFFLGVVASAVFDSVLTGSMVERDSAAHEGGVRRLGGTGRVGLYGLRARLRRQRASLR